MLLSNKNVLITGGGTGIGFAIAEALSKKNNKILICGRREDKLKKAKAAIPSLEYYVGDLRRKDGIKKFFKWTIKNYPEVSILINNAGIQRMLNLKESVSDLTEEIEINLISPILLTSYLVEHFKSKQEAVIVNVTSGLGFSPLAVVPLYCASKAALHSYTMSLRHQLKDTSVKVFELIPPIVDTELDKGSREKRGIVDRGIRASTVAEELIRGVEANESEIIVGMAKGLREAGDKAFERMNH